MAWGIGAVVVVPPPDSLTESAAISLCKACSCASKCSRRVFEGVGTVPDDGIFGMIYDIFYNNNNIVSSLFLFF
jgi:hypothetical protein